MAYADDLDPATPPSGGAVGQGDDEIRKKTRAIRERLGSFFVDVDADPMVPKPDSVPNAALTDNSIDGTKIKIASLPYDRLTNLPGSEAPADSVSTASLQAKSVTNEKIADGAVDTRTLANGAVTSDKLADNSVGSAKISDGAIHRSELSTALQQVLPYIHLLYITLPAATTIADGGVYRGGENLTNTLDTNDKSGYLTPVLIEPVMSAVEVSGAIFWSDAVIMHAAIAMVGGQETVVYRLCNESGVVVDISSQIIMIAIMQTLDTSPGGAL